VWKPSWMPAFRVSSPILFSSPAARIQSAMGALFGRPNVERTRPDFPAAPETENGSFRGATGVGR
jgi:hypothetical protein